MPRKRKPAQPDDPVGLLVVDLMDVREAGLLRLRELAIPNLRAIAQQASPETPEAELHEVVEQLLRDALGVFVEESDNRAAAEIDFGLSDEYREEPSGTRRQDAAKEVRSISSQGFAKSRERTIVRLLAEGILTAHRRAATTSPQAEANTIAEEPAGEDLFDQMAVRGDSMQRLDPSIVATLQAIVSQAMHLTAQVLAFTAASYDWTDDEQTLARRLESMLGRRSQLSDKSLYSYGQLRVLLRHIESTPEGAAELAQALQWSDHDGSRLEDFNLISDLDRSRLRVATGAAGGEVAMFIENLESTRRGRDLLQTWARCIGASKKRSRRVLAPTPNDRLDWERLRFLGMLNVLIRRLLRHSTPELFEADVAWMRAELDAMHRELAVHSSDADKRPASGLSAKQRTVFQAILRHDEVMIKEAGGSEFLATFWEALIAEPS